MPIIARGAARPPPPARPQLGDAPARPRLRNGLTARAPAPRRHSPRRGRPLARPSRVRASPRAGPAPAARGRRVGWPRPGWGCDRGRAPAGPGDGADAGRPARSATWEGCFQMKVCALFSGTVQKLQPPEKTPHKVPFGPRRFVITVHYVSREPVPTLVSISQRTGCVDKPRWQQVEAPAHERVLLLWFAHSMSQLCKTAPSDQL